MLGCVCTQGQYSLSVLKPLFSGRSLGVELDFSLQILPWKAVGVGVLYKAPVEKWVADLQWGIIHGA